jgi:hypothetical protein
MLPGVGIAIVFLALRFLYMKYETKTTATIMIGPTTPAVIINGFISDSCELLPEVEVSDVDSVGSKLFNHV